MNEQQDIERRTRGKKAKLINIIETGHIFSSAGKIKPGEMFEVPEDEALLYIRSRKAQRVEAYRELNESAD